MATEQRLKDAKITLKLDVQGAKDALAAVPEAHGGEGTSKSTPGAKPPSPGRESDQKDQEQEHRDERRAPRQNRPAAIGIVASGRRGGSLVIGAVKVLAGAAALSTVADIVPGMIDKRLSQLDDNDWISFGVLKAIEVFIGMPLAHIGDGLRSVQSQLAIIGPLAGAAVDVARSNEMLQLGLTNDDLAAAARLQGSIGGIEDAFRKQRRKGARVAIGGAILAFGDEAKEDIAESLKKAAATNK